MVQDVTIHGSLPSNYGWNVAVLYLSFFRAFKECHPVLEVCLLFSLSIYSKISFIFILD